MAAQDDGDARPRRSLRALLSVLVPAAILVGIVLFGSNLVETPTTQTPPTPGDAALSAAGQETYEAICAACHGSDLRGTNSGPPFLDVVYAPNHHGDESFQRAVAVGVPQHHWNFGSMPAIGGLNRDDVAAVVAYVRAQQIDAGILRDPSHP